MAQGRDTKMLRDLMDRAAERIGQELKGQPVAEAEMLPEALATQRKLLGNDNPDVALSLE